MAVGEQGSEAGDRELPWLDGKLAFNGPLMLSIPLPGAAGTIKATATLDGATRVRIDDPQCVRIDVQGTLEAPLAVRLPLPGGTGRLDVDAKLGGDAELQLSLPGVEGRLQARLRAIGAAALLLDLPDAGGHLGARAALNTPLACSLLLPAGRAKLHAHDSVTLQVTLRLQPARGGSVEAAFPLEVSFNGVLFTPSGNGRLQATAPFRMLVRLRDLVLPQLPETLSLDLRVEGGAELAAELPAAGMRLRGYFTAALPLAPLLRLLHDELERHVAVEHIEAGTPRLHSAYDLVLPLRIVARRGVQARLEVIAQLHIEPRSKQLLLRSVHAEGLNAAGRAAAWLYVNPRLLRSLRNTVLWDPLQTLPPEMRIEALGFKAAGRDELSVEGVVVWNHE